jgi:hypothetical protein
VELVVVALTDRELHFISCWWWHGAGSGLERDGPALLYPAVHVQACLGAARALPTTAAAILERNARPRACALCQGYASPPRSALATAISFGLDGAACVAGQQRRGANGAFEDPHSEIAVRRAAGSALREIASQER